MWEKLKEWLPKVMIGIYLMAVLVSLIIVLYSVYKLKEAYAVGEATLAECGDEYLEKDRGDYKVKEAYDTQVKNLLEGAFKMLSGLVAFTALIMVVFHISMVIVYWNLKPDPNKLPLSIMVGDKLTDWPKTQRIIHAGLLGVSVYLMTNWFRNTFDSDFKDTKQNISPLRLTKQPDSALYASQITQLIALAVITLLAITLPLNNNASLQPVPSLYKVMAWTLVGVFIVAALLVPTVSSIILKIRKPVDEYTNNYNTIGLDITEKEQEATLLQNIYQDNPSKPFPEIDDYTVSTLRPYVTHNVNYSDLQSIQLPNELRPFFHYTSLKGEAFLKLKQDLVGFYNDKNKMSYRGIPENKTATAPAVHTNNNLKGQGFDQTLYNNIFKHLTRDYRDVLLKNLPASLSSSENELKNNLLEALNLYVITNTSLEKASPFSSETQTKLRQMRENTSIKETVTSIYNTSSAIIFTIIAALLYIFIHFVYLNYRENALMAIAAVILVVVLMGGSFVGFATKDTWL
jgi:hypothetical protein